MKSIAGRLSQPGKRASVCRGAGERDDGTGTVLLDGFSAKVFC